MLERSDTSVSQTLKAFSNFNMDVCLFVPTPTGLTKGYMDAIASAREYLEETRFHSYALQFQGQEYKVVRQAFFVYPDRLEETQVSLYRPKTKNGDPRIGFYGLKHYANPYNLLAVIAVDGALYAINCSNQDNLRALENPYSPIGKIAQQFATQNDTAVYELLDMLQSVGSQGFVPSLRAGSTGVGMTLETLLGIPANANKTPDYKGIEIKAKRKHSRAPSRSTLFSQVPNWNLSPIGSAWNLLSTFGYYRDGKLRLNHEMNAIKPNSLGFSLEIDPSNDWLRQNHTDPNNISQHIITWELPLLRHRLAEKHPQTFWVSAETQENNGSEMFHYVAVEHTKRPKIRNFDALIDAGVITVDYLMSDRGNNKVRDHGYLFKIHQADFGALFPPSNYYSLV